MALSVLKNKVTGELKKLEAGSEEYLKLAAERIEGTVKPLWEDRGVAGHAELDIEPATGNVNDRDYDANVKEKAPDGPVGVDTDLEFATGADREIHARVHDSGTDATAKAQEGPQEGSGSSEGSGGPQSGSQAPQSGSSSSSGQPGTAPNAPTPAGASSGS